MVLFQHRSECVCSYAICVVLAVIALTITIEIGAYFAYSRWYLKKDITPVKFGIRTPSTIQETYKWEISNKLKLKIEHINFLMI